MYHVTEELAAALAAKRLNLKAVCGSTTLEGNQIANCTYSASIGGSDALTIGGVTAAMVTLTINQEVAWRDKTIAVSVGAEVDGTTQYVPLGTFAVTDCKQAEGTTTITAYDAAYYALGGTYTPTVSSGTTVAAVLSDVATQCGLTLATLPAAASTTNVVGDLTGKNCRDMVGYLAALVGCNALIDRDGKLALRWFASSGQSYSPSDYYNAGLSIDGTSTLACIRAEVETTTTDADGNTSVTTNTYTAGSTGVGISIQNPYMTQAILDAVWASIGGLEYTVGSCDIFHGLLVEPGDLVTITDKAGVAHTLAVMTLELSIDGGCRAKIQATADSATDTGANVSGSMTKQITKIAKDVMEFYTIVAQKAKVTDLEATNAEISSLKTEKANVADLNAATAEINTLKTNKASVADLTAATGRITDLEADTASLGQAVAEKASITDLNATNAEVSTLKADKADVDLLNVVKATIENLLVRGGIITDSLSGVEINATKFLTGVTIIGDVIKAGTLQADRIILTGENGLIYELNVNAGNLTASQLTQEQYKQALDGSVLVASSITTDKLAAEAVTAEKIDVKNLFAQTIEATGTIKGGTLKGTEIIGAILKGGAINIEGSFEGYAGTEKGYLKTENNGSGTPHLILGMGSASITLEPNGMSDVVIDGSDIYVGAPGKASSTSVYDLYINHSITADCDFNEYEISASGVVTSGTIRVVKKLGWCLVHGGITLSATASDWITILNSARVPGTQHGESIFKTIPYWGTSYGRPLRVSVMADGGLRIRYGSKGEFQFDFCYPIE